MYVNDALAIWGGLERVLIEKANLLATLADYEVCLVTLNQGSHTLPYPISPKVRFYDLGIQFHRQYQNHGLMRLVKRLRLNRMYKQRLRQKIQEVYPDIIVCARAELVSVIVKVKGDIPLVYESHTSRRAHEFLGSDFYTRFKVACNNRNVKAAQMVVALTEGDAKDWREINPRVCVIPNMVTLNNTDSYSDCQAKSAIFVGRFSAQKDISTLLRIWKKIHQRYPYWQLQLYGGYGEEQDRLLPVIKHMQANIVVHDPTPDIFNRYKENSILLLTSRFEPFGLVLPEAMSCGLPVVAFDCPYGPADIISDRNDGFLVHDRSEEEFVEKVCLLMENSGLRQRMGQAGILSSQRYKADRILPFWKELFEHLSRK
jgi:glycosyltransferase involved in cell wall biosynthesis